MLRLESTITLSSTGDTCMFRLQVSQRRTAARSAVFSRLKHWVFIVHEAVQSFLKSFASDKSSSQHSCVRVGRPVDLHTCILSYWLDSPALFIDSPVQVSVSVFNACGIFCDETDHSSPVLQSSFVPFALGLKYHFLAGTEVNH